MKLVFFLVLISILNSQDESDLPDFTNESNRSDIEFIIQYAPLPSALQRTEKLLRPWLEKKQWSRANEIIDWSIDLFTSKDPDFNTEYFDKIAFIINSDDSYYQPIPLFGGVNTNQDEYWPSIHYNLRNEERHLYFTRHNGKHEDIYVSHYDKNHDVWSNAIPIKNLNTKRNNEAVFSVSHDGKRLITYRARKNDNKDHSDLYISNGEKYNWKKPELLPKPINRVDGFEGGGFITVDSKYILFSSDRVGGVGKHRSKVGEDYGNQDLYVSTYLDNNDWSEPINLGGVINTAGAEVTPFLSYDGSTLYFSSDGHPGLGGRDVFKTTRSNINDWENWTEPENLGKYVNTVGHDEGFKISPLNNYAYFDRENEMGNKDIYKLLINDDYPPQLKKVKVEDSNDNPMEGVEVLAINPVNNDTLGSGTTDSSGIALLLIPHEEKYSSTDSTLDVTQIDTDGDKIPDYIDNDIDGDGINNKQDKDDDGDGIPDEKEKDTDGDKIPDDMDNDIDGDGINNEQDKDDDGDGIPDEKGDPPVLYTLGDNLFPVAEPEPDKEKQNLFIQNNLKPIRHQTSISEDIFDLLLEEIDSLSQDSELVTLPPNSVKLIWPVRSRDSTHYAYDAVSVYMDHDPKIGGLRDYNCGDHTYDLEGYNHTGTDIMLWPFSWHMMDQEIIEVVAASGGLIVDKLDGQYDRNCDLESATGQANYVFILHRDGSMAIYLHLKEGSVLNKSIGDTVVQGEYLGLVGSSGQSTGPHLHFELLDSDMNPTDPFGGPCDGPSWWEDQRKYKYTGINRISSHYRHPTIPSCPEPEKIYEENIFFQGDSVFLTCAYRNVRSSIISNHTIMTPSNDIFEEFSSSSDVNFVAYPHIKLLKLPKDAEPGEWRYHINYNSKTYEHSFLVQEGQRPAEETPDRLEDEIDIITLKSQSITTRKTKELLPVGDDYICEKTYMHFDHDSDSLNITTKYILDRIANYLIQNNMSDVKVIGYSSSIGSKEYNLDLSQRRAYNVKRFLEEKGIRYVRHEGRGENEILRDAYGRELEDKSRRVKICYRRGN